MLIELDALTEADVGLLDNLAQLYLYDFSEFDMSEVRPDGRFTGWIDWSKLFDEGTHHVYLIKVDSSIAGFLSVCEDSPAFRDPKEKVFWMDEFFVMRRFRGMRVGERVATTMFERFPGTWEIGQIRSNTGAREFWRRVIGRYAGGDFVEIELDDDRWVGTVQYFNSSSRG